MVSPSHICLLSIDFKRNKTGSRQCTQAVWSTFAEIHSTHPGALMHCGECPTWPCVPCNTEVLAIDQTDFI